MAAAAARAIADRGENSEANFAVALTIAKLTNPTAAAVATVASDYSQWLPGQPATACSDNYWRSQLYRPSQCLAAATRIA